MSHLSAFLTLHILHPLLDRFFSLAHLWSGRRVVGVADYFGCGSLDLISNSRSSFLPSFPISIRTFNTLTVRLARIVVNAYLENVDLVARTLESFGDDAATGASNKSSNVVAPESIIAPS